MKKNKTSKKCSEHKFSFDPINNADSMWNRTQYQKIFKGKDLRQLINLDDEGPGSLQKPPPLKMSDILDSMYEDEIEEESE